MDDSNPEDPGKQEKPSLSFTNEDRVSVVSIVCRICFDDNKDETIITPCRCKGTVAFVHRSCLEKWLAESNTTSCELCHHIYETERIPKYTAGQSIWRWLVRQPSNLGFQIRRMRGDLLVCAVLTPLAVLITYICLFSADYYNQRRFANIPAAKWTSISLLVMISIMLFGYYVWVYVVVGYHGRTWYYWWQRECIVRYIPPRTPPNREERRPSPQLPEESENNSESDSKSNHSSESHVVEINNAQQPLIDEEESHSPNVIVHKQISDSILCDSSIKNENLTLIDNENPPGDASTQ